MADESQFRLLGQRRFAPFFLTQFLGALNDNVFRNSLLFLVTFQQLSIAGMDDSQLANVAGALFILPFFLFSAMAGQLADRYEKSMLIRRIKLFEIALMCFATAAFLTAQFVLLLFILFLMGLQSTLFGPVKYAYLPQQLDDSELVGGNALVEAGTYIAIILGLIVGGIAITIDPDTLTVLVSCLLLFSLAGYLFARRIPTTPAADPGLVIRFNAWRETFRLMAYARENKSVYLSILGVSWFWFFGFAMTLQLPAYTFDILGGNEAVTTALLVAFAVGVGIGSLLCERLSGHRIELGLVPFGSIGLTVFAVDLYFAQPLAATSAVSSLGEFLARPGSLRVLADLALLGAFAGIYSVPLYALIQARSERRHLSRVIAANNIINSIFMIAAALLSLAVLAADFSIPELFVLLAVLNALVAIYIYTLLPEFLMRFLAWLLTSVLYRVEVKGTQHIPATGPALVVCNHVSYVDPVILSGAVRRPMRFVMWYRIFEIPGLRFFFKQAKAIPIASAKEDETIMHAAFESVDAELAAGHVVCIFPEGGITRDGEIQRFRPGLEKILERRAVPVIPVSLGRLWGSWFSRRKDGGVRRLPGRLFARVPVRIGEPVTAKRATAPRLEMLVRTLRGDER
ncbi:MAG: MFS transporter [Pseudomonadota bacterium]